MIVTDVLKRFLHSGLTPATYYLRTYDGLEVDLLLELGQRFHLIEIKSAMTIWPKHGSSLYRISRELTPAALTSLIISASSSNFQLKDGVFNYNWKNILGF
jgi:hypothetical protein